MSADETLYAVELKHLSADAKTASADLAEVQLAEVTSKKLQALLKALAALAPRVTYPAAPEIRVNAPQGKFIVQVKDSQLRLVSWSSASPTAGALTADQVFAAITGELQADDHRAAVSDPSMPSAGARRRRYVLLGVAIVGIVAANGMTAWFTTRPPKDLLPKYEALQPEPAERILTSVVGAYETGGGSGDRRLVLRAGGVAVWSKFGAARAIADEKTFTVKAAQVGGQPALLTSSKAMIEIKDPVTLVMFGDTYRRVAK